MDQGLIHLRAQELEAMLHKYEAADREVAQLHSALKILLRSAQAGTILDPVEWGALPGRYFSEGSLGKYPDLESSYSRFAIEVTGGESPALLALRRQMSRGRP